VNRIQFMTYAAGVACIWIAI